ncbi:hypothetical protein OnM2_098006 [Erysiphe neolycopersici]|uniref:Uncharacterized protein n=1 Tax=Erysiphe neolycopersici TaxID=212602 RepID=A0A420HAF0_9PEZI|nr:hypothetical protein OnM2_098006 [Erysiphe neolycopersici]
MLVNQYFSELALSEESSDPRIAPTENSSSFFYVPSSPTVAQKQFKFSTGNSAVESCLEPSKKVTLDHGFSSVKKQSSTTNKMKLRNHQIEEIYQENDCEDMKILSTSHIKAKLEKDSWQTSISANPQRANNLVFIDKINSLTPYNKNQKPLDESLVPKPKENLKKQSLSSNQNGHLASKLKANECDNTQILGSTRINPSIDAINLKDNGIIIVDPVRAALTWQEDEITGYDVIDPEDDGEGINGIGFRPTPMESYIRMEKRKKQLAAYRDQEAKDARSLRRERRNLPHNAKKILKERKLAKRVRFKETEVKNLSF